MQGVYLDIFQSWSWKTELATVTFDSYTHVETTVKVSVESFEKYEGKLQGKISL